jgi:hypothetical protein
MTYELSVDRAHLDYAWRLLAPRIRRIKAAERAILGFDGRCLTIEVRNAMVHAQAVGVWPGNAVVSATTIAALTAAPMAGDRVTVSCDLESVKFGPLKVGCVWQPISEKVMDLDPVADWLCGIAIKYTMSRGQIVSEGLTQDVAVAEQKLAAIVKRAAKTLAPIGISASELEWLIEFWLEHHFVHDRGEGKAADNR